MNPEGIWNDLELKRNLLI